MNQKAMCPKCRKIVEPDNSLVFLPTKKDKPGGAIKGYKGFDKDLKCRGHQYEVGMAA